MTPLFTGNLALAVNLEVTRALPTLVPPPLSALPLEATRPEARGDSYISPESNEALRESLLPFGPDVVDRTAIMAGFQAINTGNEARKYLAVLESGDLDRLRVMLQGAAMVADAWEELQRTRVMK